MDQPTYKHKSGSSKRSAQAAMKLRKAGSKCAKLTSFMSPASSISTSSAAIPESTNITEGESQPPDKSTFTNENEQAIEHTERELPASREVEEEQISVITALNAIRSHEVEEEEISVSTPLNDISTFQDRTITKELKVEIVKLGAHQPVMSFPKTDGCSFSKTFYVFVNDLGESRPRWWLGYSSSLDTAYCHCCWLFSDHPKQWKDWKHLHTRLKEHGQLKSHIKASHALQAFLSNQSIDTALKTQIEEENQRWKYIMNVQIDVLRTLCALNLPLRGSSGNIDDPDCGVYLTIMKLMARHIPQLSIHLNSGKRIKYMSNTIMEEQVRTIAGITRQRLLDDINEAVFWTIIIDGTTDISKTDQLALLVRYVKTQYGERKVEVKESFVDFFNVSDHTAKGLTDGILRCCKKHNLKMENLVGQAYDGASVMKAKDGGVQQLLRQMISDGGEEPFVPYVHCPPHQLNLVAVHAAEKNASIVTLNFFGMLQEFYTFFASSPQRRWSLLEERSKAVSTSKASLLEVALAENEDNIECDNDNRDSHDTTPNTKEAMVNRPRASSTLKSTSCTRWSANANATSALKENLPAVLDSLELLVEARHDAKEVAAAITLQKSLDFQFVVALLFWDKVLQTINVSSKLLQKKDNDLFQVVQFMDQTAQSIQGYRTDEFFQSLLLEARQLWETCGLDPDLSKFEEKRVVYKKRMTGEYTAHK
jgi:hypothetical protein